MGKRRNEKERPGKNGFEKTKREVRKRERGREEEERKIKLVLKEEERTGVERIKREPGVGRRYERRGV